jgi:hypothetical protein
MSEYDTTLGVFFFPKCVLIIYIFHVYAVSMKLWIIPKILRKLFDIYVIMGSVPQVWAWLKEHVPPKHTLRK